MPYHALLAKIDRAIAANLTRVSEGFVMTADGGVTIDDALDEATLAADRELRILRAVAEAATRPGPIPAPVPFRQGRGGAA